MSSTSLRGGTTKQSPVITERPILFQTEMVRAILDLRKTQTRRAVKPGIPEGKHTPWNHRNSKVWQWQSGKANVNHKEDERPCSYGKPGDLLWVRETWCFNGHYHLFKTDHLEMPFKWKPSIHMPKAAARIWLMIEDIRVERVQDISEGDALEEGVEFWNNPLFKEFRFKDYQNTHSEWRNPRSSFISLWASINGEESWNANPWVWVIQFRVLSTTGRPSDEVIQANYKEVRNG